MSNEKTSDFALSRKILLVGEGNFSFAASIIQNSRNSELTATTLLQHDECLSLAQLQNIDIIKDFGGKVYHDVDATGIENHPIIGKQLYDEIIFNFPHIPGKMKICQNRLLLKKFFLSAEKLLNSDGEIHVTLCRGQSGIPEDGPTRKWEDTWKIVEMASFSNLVLNKIKSFNVADYPGYTCSGYRGLEKKFNVDGALTCIFIRNKAIKISDFVNEHEPTLGLRNSSQIYNELEKEFHMICSDLYKMCSNSQHHPFNETLEQVKTTASEVFKIVHLLSLSSKIFCSVDPKRVPACNVNLLKLYLSQWDSPVNVFNTFVTDIEPLLDEESTSVIAVSNTLIPCLKFNDKNGYNPTLMIFSWCYEKLCNLLQLICGSFFGPGSYENDFKFKSTSAEDIKMVFSRSDVPNEKSENSACCISYIYACCEKNIVEGYQIYENVHFVVDSQPNTVETPTKHYVKIGTVNCLCHNSKYFYYLILDVMNLAMLKYNVFDKRLLCCDPSYTSTSLVSSRDREFEIYRSPSLYPLSYVHDVSFWIKGDFSEETLVLFVMNFLREIVFSVDLIDTFCDKKSGLVSKCYRFVYCSIARPLSPERAREIHNEFTRPQLQRLFNIKLR